MTLTQQEQVERALTVACADCTAPAGTPCYTQGDYTVHAIRLTAGAWAAAEHGSCGLCGRPLVRAELPTGPDVLHPDAADADACPPIPDPNVDRVGWATAINLGYSRGRPGIEHFIPETTRA